MKKSFPVYKLQMWFRYWLYLYTLWETFPFRKISTIVSFFFFFDGIEASFRFNIFHWWKSQTKRLKAKLFPHHFVEWKLGIHLMCLHWLVLPVLQHCLHSMLLVSLVLLVRLHIILFSETLDNFSITYKCGIDFILYWLWSSFLRCFLTVSRNLTQVESIFYELMLFELPASWSDPSRCSFRRELQTFNPFYGRRTKKTSCRKPARTCTFL